MESLTYPRFILHKQRVLERYRQLKEHGLIVAYSWKTNPKVGALLEEMTDSMFAIHTLQELEKIRDTRKVWYFLLATPEAKIKKLLSSGVRNFVIDLQDDLQTLLEILEKTTITINLLLRINLRENTIFTGKYYVFGMDANTINNLIPQLRSNHQIEKLGIHFHRKTQNVSEWMLKEEVIEFMTAKNLKKLDIIDIGGGLPGKYKNTDDRVLGIIFKHINELQQAFAGELVIEPGRFIASHAIDLETRIIAIRDNTIFVDCSVFNAAPDSILSNVKLLVDGELPKGEKWIIKGNTPASEDILRYEVFLRKKPKVGDTVRFLNAGAYNFHTEFCDLERIETIVV